MSSLIGKSLQGGKYKLESVLGRGGFGLTFRAHQVYLDQVVVIKTLHESHWLAPNLSDLQRQFQDEARRLALCSHPNVVRVSDFFIEDGLPYMVMDYIPGRSLADIVLHNNPLPVKASIDYISQIGRALQAVHAKGLLHRDVKPQNIMIHQLTGEAVLIDFGIARELTQNPTQTHTSIVSEGYAPIEQYLPKAQRSAATDIYGLAATLYTLLTAEVPVAAVLRDRNPLVPIQQLRPDVSATMADAIAQGMNIELKDRPQSVGRWLTMLTAKPSTRLFGRTQPQPASTVAGRYTANTSQVPTQIATPGYRSLQPETGSKTVAMPIPTGYGESAYRPNPAPQTNRRTALQPPPATASKGLGCGSILGLLMVGLVGVVGGAGFWLYQQVDKGLAEMPELSLPEVKLPEVKLPDVKLPDVKLPTEADDEKNGAADEAITDPTGDDASEEGTENGENSGDYIPLPDQPDNNAGASLPLLLANSGNPAAAQSGNSGEMVAVPGFAPGTSEARIIDRLGTPSQESTANGFRTSTYSVVPNRVTLGYVYDAGSGQVRQSEAAFSPATDRLVMRTTLTGMLDGHSSRELEEGLEAVRTGTRDRVLINSGGFTGAIARNTNDYVHIYVQDYEQ